MEDKICVCGDLESEHIDGCEQCAVVGCGCKEFEEIVTEQSTSDMDEGETDHTIELSTNQRD